MQKGIVIEFLVKEYVIIDLETKEKHYAKIKGKLRYCSVDKNKNKILKKIEIKIGDIVFYEKKNDVFLIDSIMPRFNSLKRPNIANINQALLVFSLKKPKFHFKLLDKFLLILNKYKIKVNLIFSKIDLLNQEELKEFKQKILYYEQFYDINFVDSKNKIGLENLYKIFKNKVTILAGQTGVGKSTLINAITSLNLKTQEVSKGSNRGKHTTKNSKLYFFNEGYIADTPGFTKLNLSDINFNEVKNFYNDFVFFSTKCFFGFNCLHIKEKNCKIKEICDKGLIPKIRYNNYLSLLEEIEKKNFKRKKRN
ncbi:ribosome small subunit-dependent GTPase A [Texas Phoenix palm phytoplasma]|uniref:Small ribosomal subunit biogenesis GTPase RsgA n=1 Tax=Texas Phoenix palm phytoplasma TaxID=176709 RepID=A0ABS5BIV1_9MOLU|nr:ribosome small subunit-dependent GTPase A [Texas Phoenix palm phytoplasma]MBP3059506.1 ribosome small subunit-dependent GTPase A [Texas Phoenix palm phytoplasma]